MNQQKIERKFVANTVQNFVEWCETRKEPVNLENYTIWLMKHALIPEKEVKRAFVVETVKEVAFCENVTKTDALAIIEDQYGIPVRTSFSILSNHGSRFT